MRSLIRGYFAQLHVIQALIIRETQTRFGRHSLGYLWAFAEPLMWIGTFLLLFQLGKRQTPNGMDSVGFLATGLSPFILFRSTVSRTMKAIKSNKALLYYPQIRPLDLVIARAILEVTTMTIVFVILLLGNTIYTGHLPLDNALQIVIGLLFGGLLATGLGLTLASLTSMVPSVENLVSPILRPLLWISGIFFSASELPSNVREIMLWNPLLQIVEITRDGWFKSYDFIYYDYNYLMLWILTLGFLGLTLERVARRHLEV